MSILRDLCQLLLQSGCRPQRVVSSLAFYPPDPPSYSLERARVNVLDALRPPSGSWSAHGPSDVGGSRTNTSSSPGIGMGSTYLLRMDGSIPRAPWPVHLTLITEIVTRRRKRIPACVWMYPGARYTLLFSHGNGVDIGLMQETLVHLAANLRVHVVAYDYTGYGAGRQAGPPTEADVFADIQAVLDWCCRSGQAWGCTGPQDIILYGQSLGTAATLYAACRMPVRAVILHSPMTSGLRIFVQNRACLALCDAFDNLSRLPQLRAGAVLILHGQDDEVIPVSHGERVLHAVPKRYTRVPCFSPVPQDGSPFVQAWFPPNAGHADVEHRDREGYITRCRFFLSSLSPGAQYEDYIHAPVLGEEGVVRLVASGVLLATEKVPEPPGRRAVDSSPRCPPSSASMDGGDGSGPGSPAPTPLPPSVPVPVSVLGLQQGSRIRSKSMLDAAAGAIGTAIASIGTSTASDAGQRAREGSVAASSSLPAVESLQPPPVSARHASFLSVSAMQQPSSSFSPPSWPSGSAISGAAKDSTDGTRTSRVGSVLAHVQRAQGVQDWAEGTGSADSTPTPAAVDWAAKVRMPSAGDCANRAPAQVDCTLACSGTGRGGDHGTAGTRGGMTRRGRSKLQRGGDAAEDDSSCDDDGTGRGTEEAAQSCRRPRSTSKSRRRRRSSQKTKGRAVTVPPAMGSDRPHAGVADDSSSISDADA